MSAGDMLNEVVILLPDAIVFGSLLIGVLTISPVQALFFFSLLESFGFLYLLQQFIGYLNGKTRTELISTCKSKYHNLTFQERFFFFCSDSSRQNNCFKLNSVAELYPNAS